MLYKTLNFLLFFCLNKATHSRQHPRDSSQRFPCKLMVLENLIGSSTVVSFWQNHWQARKMPKWKNWAATNQIFESCELTLKSQIIIWMWMWMGSLVDAKEHMFYKEPIGHPTCRSDIEQLGTTWKGNSKENHWDFSVFRANTFFASSRFSREFSLEVSLAWTWAPKNA